MTDLIERNDLVEILKDARAAGCVDPYRNGIRENICDEFLEIIEDREMIPTVDAVPIIRCKDCKHMINCYRLVLIYDDDSSIRLRYRYLDNIGSGFCSLAERKEK